MNRNNSLVYILLVIYLFSLFFLCLYDFSDTNIDELPKFVLGIPADKCAHFVMFLPSVVLMSWFLWQAASWRNRKMILSTAFIVCMAMALLTELSQRLLTANRAFELTDLLADGLAVVCGSGVAALMLRRMERRAKA